jgi:hypothetical protein
MFDDEWEPVATLPGALRIFGALRPVGGGAGAFAWQLPLPLSEKDLPASGTKVQS